MRTLCIHKVEGMWNSLQIDKTCHTKHAFDYYKSCIDFNRLLWLTGIRQINDIIH